MPNPNAQATDDATDDDTLVIDGEDGGAGAQGDGSEAGDGADAAAEAAANDATEGDGEESGDQDEVIVSIGDETPPEDDQAARAPNWLRELRKSNREKDRRIRELEQKLQTPAASEAPALGEKPTLKGCDYDEEGYEAKLADWHAKKRQIDDAKAAQEAAAKKAQDEWNARLKTYRAGAQALKVPDFEDAEAAVQDRMSVVQQGVILKGAEKPELIIYALAKNPKKLAELSAITDPIAFAFAVAKVETMLKVQPRKSAPVPAPTIRGSAPGAGAASADIDRLYDKAKKTGDYTEYLAAKRARQQKAA